MISQFQGPYRFLSNFRPSSGSTVEHLYQASKTNQPAWKLYILTAPTPSSAKRRAKEIPLEYRRGDWDKIKTVVMFDLLKQKFATGKLREQLLATGNEELIEGNTWGDTFWGVCNGKGQNRLGKMLMQIRKELRSAV